MAITGSDFYSGYMTVKGFDSIYDAIRKLPEEVGKGIIQDALMHGAIEIGMGIKSAVPHRTGKLKRSVTERWHGGRRPGWFETMNGAGVQIDVGPEYSRAKKGFAAHLVERGTRPHLIVAGLKYRTTRSGRKKGRLTTTKVLYDKYTNKFFGKAVEVSARANPFTKRGFLAKKGAALMSIQNRLVKGIEGAFTKVSTHG